MSTPRLQVVGATVAAAVNYILFRPAIAAAEAAEGIIRGAAVAG